MSTQSQSLSQKIKNNSQANEIILTNKISEPEKKQKDLKIIINEDKNQEQSYEIFNSNNSRKNQNTNTIEVSQNSSFQEENNNNTDQQLNFQQDQEKQIDQFIICVDPETGQIYSQAINSNLIIIETNIPNYITCQAQKALQNLDLITNYQNCNWLFSQEAMRFKRRKIPSYLLHKDQSEYPLYLSQSRLSKAFENVNKIKLQVNLQQYKNQLNDGQKLLYTNQNKQNEYIGAQELMNMPNVEQGDGNVFEDIDNDKEQEQETFFIFIDALLVTGADQVINNIIREVQQEYNQILKPQSINNKFILQVQGFKEYIYDNYPILQFERVRISLRGHEHLDVVLTEIPIKNKNEDLFPPIIERDIQDINNDIIKPIQWKKYKNIPMIIWYPQVNLQDIDSSEQQILWVDEKEKNSKINEINQAKNFQDLIKIQSLEEQDNDEKFEQQQCIYSGECDTPFRLRILGLSNLLKVFSSTHDKMHQEDCAIYNGIVPPSYITFKKEIPKQDKNDEKIQQQQQQLQLTNSTIKIFEEQGSKIKNFKQNSRFFQSSQNIGQQDSTPYNQTESTLTLNHNSSSAMKDIYANIKKDFGFDCQKSNLKIKCSIYYGLNLFSEDSVQITKKQVPFKFYQKFYEWIQFGSLKLSQLQKNVKICFEVILQNEKFKPIQVIASTSFKPFDENGILRQGPISLNLWPFYKIEPRMGCMQQFWGCDRATFQQSFNILETERNQFYAQNFAQIQIQLEQFSLPVQYSLRDQNMMQYQGYPNFQPVMELDVTPSTNQLANLQFLLNSDPTILNQFTEKEKYMLLICRNYYKTYTNALQILLSAIKWTDPEQIRIAHEMVLTWTPIQSEDALALINGEFMDDQIRLYAAERISTLSDEDLALYLLELIQALFNETSHFSPIGEMLLERAIKNPHQVGHEYFWQLKSQTHLKASFERVQLYMEQFVMLSGSFRGEIAKEVSLNLKLNEVGANTHKLQQKFIQRGVDKKKHLKFIREQVARYLNNVDLEYKQKNQTLSLALNRKMQCKNLSIQQCRVFNSKKLPILLVAHNQYPQGQYIRQMLKCGDDIRQDQLTLQLIKIMDKIWLDNGYDFRMRIYQVKPTQDQVGLIEFVSNSNTLSKIQVKQGKYTGAFKDKSIEKFLKKFNKDQMYETAQYNFSYSCAGYCVATYILGIGDRHSDNIMITQTGHLFHIDYGHILGNKKTKYGIDRETDCFVLTTEMVQVMGGKDGKLFKQFQSLCTQAYNLIRKHGNFLINILMIMISAGMPELQSVQDISYLRDQLSLDLSDQQADKKFKEAIKQSLSNVRRKLDHTVHNLVKNEGKKN